VSGWASAALAALATALLLAAAWLFPPLAILAIWPILFVVPGWALMAWARPRMAATGRLGLAVVLSVAISAHLIYWVSLATGGYRRETIFAAAFLLAVPIPIAAGRAFGHGGIRAAARREVLGAVSALARSRAAFGLALGTSLFVATVLSLGLWQVTPLGVDSGGSNWSDLGVHLSIAQSLNAGNFPPQVPYFAGAPLVYHWFADFHAAIAARAAGLFAIPAFAASSAILAGALVLLVHGLALQLLRIPGGRRVALIAAGLAVFGGGLGYIRLIGDVTAGLGDPISLVTRNSYDNAWLTEWPYFRIPSVMGTGLLVHRATTAGLPMLVGAVLLLVAGLPSADRLRRGWRDRPALIGLAGLLGALLAPFHFFFFPAVLMLAFVWVVVGGRLTDRAAPVNALRFLAPYVLSLPFALAPLLQSAGSGQLKLVQIWESAPTADGPSAVAFFYVTNLGLPLVLAVVALVVARGRWRLFLGVWAVALFAVPNVVQASAIGFDMNKYFQAMWIAVAILAAWLIRRWPWPAVAAVLLISVPSPLLVSAWTALSHEQMLNADQLAAATWIADNTPDRSVFATDGWLHSPTDAAGRLRLLTFQPYVANLGYDPAHRAAQVDEIYCAGSASLSAAVMGSLGARYVIAETLPSPCRDPVDFADAPQFHEVFQAGGLRIFELTDGAAVGPVSSVR
jgi:hypothetical protein